MLSGIVKSEQIVALFSPLLLLRLWGRPGLDLGLPPRRNSPPCTALWVTIREDSTLCTCGGAEHGSAACARVGGCVMCPFMRAGDRDEQPWGKKSNPAAEIRTLGSAKLLILNHFREKTDLTGVWGVSTVACPARWLKLYGVVA